MDKLYTAVCGLCNAGVINATISKDTGLSEADMDLLLKGFGSVLHRQARGAVYNNPCLCCM